MTINNFDWNHLFVNSMVNETTVSAKKINIAGLNADWSFFILIVRSLLITLLSTDFSVFPITSQCTRRVWPVIRDCTLLYDTFFYLFFVEDRFCAASILYFSFVLFLILNTVRYHQVFFRCILRQKTIVKSNLQTHAHTFRKYCKLHVIC